MLVLWLLLAAAPAEVVVAGKTPDEIILSAPRGDLPARAVVLAAAADLRRTPLRHSVRVVFFDGGETGTGDAWLRGLDPEAQGRILAHLHLEGVGWRESRGPVIHSFPARRGQAPGWLVHSVLRSSQAVGWPFAVADHRFPLLGQLVARSAKVRDGAVGEAFLRRGIPSVTLSDRSLLTAVSGPSDGRRLDRWAQALAAAVRRLETLAGRPLPEDQYLALGGRVWLRRDLMWAGFLVWALLVFRGLPGRWRGGSSEEHGRQMRAYLPGFLFRAILLAAILLAPVFAVLLLPAALLALLPPRPSWARILWTVMGLLPLLAYLLALGVALGNRIASFAGGFQGGTPAALLIPAALVAWCVLIARGPVGERRLTVTGAPGKVEI